MALLKNISTDYGIDASYWKIVEFTINLNGSCDVKINGYLNEDTRRANLSHLKSYNFSIDVLNSQIYFSEGIDVHQIYQYLKTLNEFNNAADG